MVPTHVAPIIFSECAPKVGFLNATPNLGFKKIVTAPRGPEEIAYGTPRDGGRGQSPNIFWVLLVTVWETPRPLMYVGWV